MPSPPAFVVSCSERLEGIAAEHCKPRGGARQSTSSSTSRSGAAGGTTAETSRLFENVKPLPEVEAASASGGGPQQPNTASSRVFSAISNGILYSALGTAALAGYYQYAYDVDDLQRVVDDTAKREDALPGSSVRSARIGAGLGRRAQGSRRVVHQG